MLPTLTVYNVFSASGVDGFNARVAMLPSALSVMSVISGEPASLVMEWKMLRGIKQRAERLAREGDAQLATPATTID